MYGLGVMLNWLRGDDRSGEVIEANIDKTITPNKYWGYYFELRTNCIEMTGVISPHIEGDFCGTKCLLDYVTTQTRRFPDLAEKKND